MWAALCASLPPPLGCIRREGTSEAAPEAVSQAVGGGYGRLEMPFKLALAARETVPGHAWSRSRRGHPPPFPMHPSPPPRPPPMRVPPSKNSRAHKKGMAPVVLLRTPNTRKTQAIRCLLERFCDTPKKRKSGKMAQTLCDIGPKQPQTAIGSHRGLCGPKHDSEGTPPLARATPLSEQQWVLCLQLLEPRPTWPFMNPPVVRATLGVVSVEFWIFTVALAKGGGERTPANPSHFCRLPPPGACPAHHLGSGPTLTQTPWGAGGGGGWDCGGYGFGVQGSFWGPKADVWAPHNLGEKPEAVWGANKTAGHLPIRHPWPGPPSLSFWLDLWIWEGHMPMPNRGSVDWSPERWEGVRVKAAGEVLRAAQDLRGWTERGAKRRIRPWVGPRGSKSDSPGQSLTLFGPPLAAQKVCQRRVHGVFWSQKCVAKTFFVWWAPPGASPRVRASQRCQRATVAG